MFVGASAVSPAILAVASMAIWVLSAFLVDCVSGISEGIGDEVGGIAVEVSGSVVKVGALVQAVKKMRPIRMRREFVLCGGCALMRRFMLGELYRCGSGNGLVRGDSSAPANMSHRMEPTEWEFGV